MSNAFNHTATTGQNVFYVNSVSGSNTWTGRFPWHKPDLITGDDIVSGGEGPFSTIAAAVRHSQTGNAGGAFNSSVVIVMSDGGTSGDGKVTGDSSQNWTYQTDKCDSPIDINNVSGFNCLIIGGNTGGVIDGTIATIERLGSGVCMGGGTGGLVSSEGPVVNIFGDGSSWMNLDFYSTAYAFDDKALIFHISGSHTNITNCNFIDGGPAISGDAKSSVNLNRCSFINCGTSGHPAVEINNINLYETEFNSTTNTVSIQLTGTQKVANIYNSSFINCGTAIDYVDGRCFIVDSIFVSGTGVDIDSKNHGPESGKHLISVDNFHYDAVTAYQCENERTARYIIAPLFGDGKFNHPGNSLTTGGSTTTGNYSVSGCTHNIMERYANAYRTVAASKLTASEDGYYASQFNLTSTNIVHNITGNLGRSAVLIGNYIYINDRTPESKPENSAHTRGSELINQRAISINSRRGGGTVAGGLGGDDVYGCREISCLDLMCCCADTPGVWDPVAGCKCGYDEDDGPYNKQEGLAVAGMSPLRKDGWCCGIHPLHPAYRVGDSCCLSGGSDGGGNDGISISVF